MTRNWGNPSSGYLLRFPFVYFCRDFLFLTKAQIWFPAEFLVRATSRDSQELQLKQLASHVCTCSKVFGAVAFINLLRWTNLVYPRLNFQVIFFLYIYIYIFLDKWIFEVIYDSFSSHKLCVNKFSFCSHKQFINKFGFCLFMKLTKQNYITSLINESILNSYIFNLFIFLKKFV